MDSDYLNVPTPPNPNNTQTQSSVAGIDPQVHETIRRGGKKSLTYIIIIFAIIIIGALAYTQFGTNPMNTQTIQTNVNSSCPCLTKAQFDTFYSTYTTTSTSHVQLYNYTSYSNTLQLFNPTSLNINAPSFSGTPPSQQLNNSLVKIWYARYYSVVNTSVPYAFSNTISGDEAVFQSTNAKGFYNFLYNDFTNDGGQTLESASINGLTYAYYGGEIVGYKDDYVIVFELTITQNNRPLNIPPAVIANQISYTI